LIVLYTTCVVTVQIDKIFWRQFIVVCQLFLTGLIIDDIRIDISNYFIEYLVWPVSLTFIKVPMLPIYRLKYVHNALMLDSKLFVNSHSFLIQTSWNIQYTYIVINIHIYIYNQYYFLINFVIVFFFFLINTFYCLIGYFINSVCKYLSVLSV
jgi:hypothetical protein